MQVYTDISKLPSAVDIFDTLYIGAPKPSSFGSGVYVQCTSGACASRSDIKIWSLAAEAGTLTANTIFELPAQRAGGRPFYVRNRISTVSVGSFSFRNPPSFMPLAGEMRDTSREWNSVRASLFLLFSSHISLSGFAVDSSRGAGSGSVVGPFV